MKSRWMRRRSLGRWGVLLCAFLAIAVYVAFDLMDLDGSDLRGHLLGNAIAAEPARSEAERLIPPQAVVPPVLGPAPLLSAIQALSDARKITLRAGPPPPVTRLDRIRPRAQTQRRISSAGSLTEDPA